MLPPIFRSFRIQLPRNFLYKEVEQMFENVYSDNPIYKNAVDFLNQTSVSTFLPEIEDQGLTQTYDGGRTKSFKGGLPAKEHIPKTVSVKYRLTEDYMNWIILYTNFVYYLNDKSNNTTHLPPITLQFMDYEDNVIFQIIYMGVRLVKLESIELSKQNTGIINREFGLTFEFIDIEIMHMKNKKQSFRNTDTQEYDYKDKYDQK